MYVCIEILNSFNTKANFFELVEKIYDLYIRSKNNFEFYYIFHEMKRFWIFVSILILAICPLIAFADYEVNESIKSKVSPIFSIVEKEWGKESLNKQISRYETAIKAFRNSSVNWDQQEMINYLLYLFENKVKILKSQLVSQKDVIWNVDRDLVQSTWLSWHNDERAKSWLEPYTYNELLNYTALSRAQQIASEMRKTGSTHKRNDWDGYRSTPSIKNWFSDLWVQVTYFSESNAYWAYNCKKSDCTQEMLSILKKCFDRTYMNSWHYPAIISKSYNEIWLWVAVNNWWLRVTTHYALDAE